MFKKKVDPLDIETEFLMKLAGVITQSAHSVAQNCTRAAVIFNPVVSILRRYERHGCMPIHCR